MEKKIYEKPVMQVEEFVANHYVASCSPDEDFIIYHFICDAGGGSTYQVWEDHGTIGSFNENQDVYKGNFYACRAPHDVKVNVTAGESVDIDQIFPRGFIRRRQNIFGEWVTTPVRIWYGDNNDDLHCTLAIAEEDIHTSNPS